MLAAGGRGLVCMFVVFAAVVYPSCAVSPETIKTMLHGQRIQATGMKRRNISSECLEGIRNMTTNNKVNALDSFGKPGAGILAGNINWLGHYDECAGLEDFHYCLLMLNISYLSSNESLPLPMRYGLCVPSVCSDLDVYNGVGEIPILKDIASFQSDSLPICTESPHREYDAKFISAVTFFGLLFLLVVVSSLYHAWYHSEACHRKDDPLRLSDDRIYFPREDVAPLVTSDGSKDKCINPDQPSTRSQINRTEQVLESNEQPTTRTRADEGIFCQIIFSFALPRNLPRLMSGNVSKDSIPCLNGIRVLSILWVILGHVFVFHMLVGIYNPLAAVSWFQRFGFLLISNAFFSVDSFFFLSGLLVTYLTLKQLKKRNGRIPWRWFYFHRYWRLTPAVAVTMLFYVFITPYFGEGPYAQMLSARENCPKYWWTNLLYINNFYPIHDHQMCIGWVWYLANDMQFFIISPLIILPLYHIPWLGMCLIAVLCSASTCVTAVLMAVNHFPAAVMDLSHQRLSDETFTDVIYNKPYCRINPYLVGMLLGYILYKYPRKSIKMNWIVALLGWVAALGIGFGCIFSLYNYYNVAPWTEAANVVYGMLCRLAWGGFLGWMVFACHYGYGGWVNTLLGHPAWAPLGRLTFTAYLIHPIVLFIFLSHQGTALYLSLTLMAFYFAGVSLLTYACAAIFSLMVEYPLVGLEKLFIPRN